MIKISFLSISIRALLVWSKLFVQTRLRIRQELWTLISPRIVNPPFYVLYAMDNLLNALLLAFLYIQNSEGKLHK